MIERLRQKKARSDSGTQVIGVYKSKNQSYRANICLCGEKYILGAYKTLEEAIQARKQEAQLHEPVLRAYQTWSSYVKITAIRKRTILCFLRCSGWERSNSKWSFLVCRKVKIRLREGSRWWKKMEIDACGTNGYTCPAAMNRKRKQR